MKKLFLLFAFLFCTISVQAQTALLPSGATKTQATTFLSPWTGTLNPSSPLSAQYGGTGINASSATNGFIPIGNSSGFTLAGITGTASQITVTNGSGTITLSIPSSPAFTTPAITGLATGSGVASAATVSTLSARDAQGTLAAVNWLGDFTTTATAAGTTTMDNTYTFIQNWTGSTTQTIKLPGTMALGEQYQINNLSSGALTIQSSAANAVLTMAAGTSATLTAIVANGTNAAAWNAAYNAVTVASGKVATINNTITLAGTDAQTYTFPSTSATIARTDAANTFTGIQSFNTAIVVGSGGTGVSTMTTAYAPVCAGTTATGALQVASTGLSTSGWVLTSNGSSALPSFQAPSAGMSKSTITADQTAAVNVKYTNNKASTQLVLTMPTTAAVGDQIAIIGGSCPAGAKFAGATGVIFHSSTTTGVTGSGAYISSPNEYDNITITCIVANTEWTIETYNGSWTLN